MKYFCKIFLFLLAVNLIASCSDDDDSFVLRSTDELNFTYSGASKDFTVCTDGNWTITTDATWLHFDKTSGVGDGTTRDAIAVSADRNVSTARTDSFILHAAGKDLVVRVSQEEGHPLTLGTATLSSSLQSGTSADGIYIRVPYTYGYEGQSVTITTTLSGDPASGLSVEPYTTTLTDESGVFEIPITGTPSSKGDLTISLEVDDPTVEGATLAASVVGRVILEQHFDLFIWGGDLVTGTSGIYGGWSLNANGEREADPTKADKVISWASEPADLLQAGMWSAAFIESRGMTGWTGTKGCEHPGYIKMGTAKVAGVLTTPALGYAPANGEATLTFRTAMYPHSSEHNVVVDIQTSEGTATPATYSFQKVAGSKSTSWEDVTVQLTGITANTKITFTCHNGHRFLLDDIVVSE